MYRLFVVRSLDRKCKHYDMFEESILLTREREREQRVLFTLNAVIQQIITDIKFV